MRTLLFSIFLIIYIPVASGQNNQNSNNMEKFNVDKFLKNNPHKQTKYETLENGDNVMLTTDRGGFAKVITAHNSNYKYYWRYDKNGHLLFKSTMLCSSNIHMGYYYDRAGNITEEVDFEKEYPFSVDEVVKQIKTDYKIDITLSKDVSMFGRWFDKAELQIPIYLLAFYDNNDPTIIWGILIDGRNGNYLLQNTYSVGDEDAPGAYHQYLELLKQGKADPPSAAATRKDEPDKDDTHKKFWSIFD